LVLPIGFLADVLGLGVFTFASPTGTGPLFAITMVAPAYRMPIFLGPQGAIGLLILAALWSALIQNFRRKQA
jgi:hypothetical protein